MLLVLAVATSCKKEEFKPNQTKEFSMQSTSTGANYHIKVALPEHYDPSSKKYDAIYVLDVEEDFDFVAVETGEQVSNYATEGLLVVSIGYGHDRSHDYTPTNTNEGSGGAEKFMHFIKDELIPKMENDFGADTLRDSRIILGHSFGGLFAAYAFTNYNHVFGNYIMLSPSLWYDNELLLRLEQDSRAVNSASGQLVFMGIGGLEGSGRMQAPFEAFYQRLNNNYPSMKISKHREAHLDHMGSKQPNIKEGLKFYFQNK